ncbi:MAG: hypothetical protein FWC40_04250 [Proteobacteria bacterium]|nr:hypothetical protein [Pseudomonadota bacterium]
MNLLRHRIIVTLLCSACTLAMFSPSPGEAQQDAFSAHMLEGMRFFNEGKSNSQNYLKAIEAFMNAKRINPIPDITYNIARSHHLYGNCTEALAQYREYQSVAGTGGDAKDVRGFISALQLECEQFLVPLYLYCSPMDATVSIDGASPVHCNAEHMVRLGQRQLKVESPRGGKPATRTVNITGDRILDLEITVDEPKEASSDVIVMAGSSLGDMKLFWTGVGLAGGGAIATITGAVLLDKAYKCKDSSWDGCDWYGRDDDTMTKAGWAVTGVGVGLSVAGIVLMIVDAVKHSDGMAQTKTIMPNVVFYEGGAAAGVTMTF